MGITGLGLLAFYQYTKDEKTKKVISSEIVSTGKPALGGPFVLVNQDGLPVTDASFRGQFLLLYFGFTFCPDICNTPLILCLPPLFLKPFCLPVNSLCIGPNELVKIGKVVEQCKQDLKLDVKPVFISVDPARDTIQQVLTVLFFFISHPTSSSFTLFCHSLGMVRSHLTFLSCFFFLDSSLQEGFPPKL